MRFLDCELSFDSNIQKKDVEKLALTFFKLALLRSRECLILHENGRRVSFWHSAALLRERLRTQKSHARVTTKYPLLP